MRFRKRVPLSLSPFSFKLPPTILSDNIHVTAATSHSASFIHTYIHLSSMSKANDQNCKALNMRRTESAADRDGKVRCERESESEL